MDKEGDNERRKLTSWEKVERKASRGPRTVAQRDRSTRPTAKKCLQAEAGCESVVLTGEPFWVGQGLR